MVAGVASFGVDADAEAVTEFVESLGIDDDDVLVSNCDDGRRTDFLFGDGSERAGDHNLLPNGQPSIKL